MSHRIAAAASGAIGLLVLACGAPAEIVLVVDGAEGSPALRTATVQVNEGDVQRSPPGVDAPWTLGIDGSGGARVQLHVEGTFDGVEDSVSADVEVELIAGERRTVFVRLDAACAGAPSCGVARTCEGPSAECVCRRRGTCPYSVVDGRIAPCTDAEPVASCEPEDAGPEDSGPLVPEDAGPDAGDSGPGRDDRFVSLGAGARHACGVLENAQVACWGSNDHGELGDDGPPRAQASRLSGALRAIAVGAGRHFSCALTTNREVECWGTNAQGQLGDPDLSRTARGIVGASAEADALAVGASHACIVRDGDVFCWGDDARGQVSGTPRASPVTTPTEVALEFEANGVVAGGRHTCAWGSGGAGGIVKCWGDDRSGQALGQLQTSLGDGVVELVAGDAHTCARVQLGAEILVRCWGDNSFHQAGPSSAPSVSDPALVDIAGASELAAGDDFTCAVSADGTRSCWGRNDEESLGVDSSEPMVVAPSQGRGGAALRAMSAGDGFGCAIDDDGRALCWGWNLAGAVGNGALIVHLAPATLPVVGMRELALGGDFGCGVIGDQSEIRCWGAGARGQLGDGTTRRARSSAASVSGGLGFWRNLVAGGGHACALAGAGPSVLCWGDNEHGQVGVVGAAPEPTEVTQLNLTLSSPLAAGDAHTCVVDPSNNGQLFCWGLADEGRTGSRTTGPTVGTFQVGYPVVDLDFGARHSCALVTLASGELGTRCWGDNALLQLGNATIPSSHSPVAPFLDEGPNPYVAAGGGFTCREGASGLECVGDNALGQLGSGAPSAPTATATTFSLGGDTLQQIAAGRDHACAVTGSGSPAIYSVSCWGDGRYGQLGHSDGIGPAVVPSGESTLFPMVALGSRSSCVLRMSGEVVCWGSDEDGRLGLGRTLVFPVPSLVVFR